jgi:hypothetical protein
MKTIRNHFWSIIASLFYAGLLFGGITFLAVGGYFNRSVGVADFLLMSIAVWRLTRLFTYDAITKFIRDWFEGARPETLAGTLSTLLNCPWCTGLWFGMMVVFFYFFTVFTWPVLLVLGISAMGSFFQVLSNLIGWSAEVKKLEAHTLQNNLTK